MRRYILVLAVAGLLLSSALFAGCTTTTTTNGTTGPTSSVTTVRTTAGGAAGQPTTIALTAQNMKFDRTTITAPAGALVAITFNNMDTGVPHNVAVYTDASASTPIFKGEIVNGPGTTTYTFTAPGTPGTYFFRCDVHPTTMTGQFIVQ